VKDLTEESIGKNILHMALPIAAGMFFQSVGVVLLGIYFHRFEHYVVFDSSAWRPQLASATPCRR
jgi:hypothetical protein